MKPLREVESHFEIVYFFYTPCIIIINACECCITLIHIFDTMFVYCIIQGLHKLFEYGCPDREREFEKEETKKTFEKIV